MRKKQIYIFQKEMKVFKIENQPQIYGNSGCQQYFPPDFSMQPNQQSGGKKVYDNASCQQEQIGNMEIGIKPQGHAD